MSSSSAFSPPLFEQLQQLTEALAATHTQAQVLDATLFPALQALDALSGAILLLDPETRRLTTAALRGPTGQTLWQNGPLTPHTPTGDALLYQNPLYFEHAGALTSAYPGLEKQTGGIAAVATAILPLLLEGQGLGVLILDFREPHTFTPEEQRFLLSLAGQCSIALGRAQLIDALQAGDTRFRRLIDASPIGIAVGAPDGQLTQVNDTYLRLLGYSRAHFEAGIIDWQSLTSLEDHARDRQAFETALREGAAPPYEKEMLTRTGERLPLGITLLRYDDRQVVGYMQDLRAYKAEQQVLRDEGQRLEGLVTERTAALQAFVNFTEAASHTQAPEQLAQLAMETITAVLPGSTALLCERQVDRWALQQHTAALQHDLRDELRCNGLPLDAPAIVTIQQVKTTLFLDGPEIAAQGIPHTETIQALAAYPLFQDGKLTHILGILLAPDVQWTAISKATIQAIGRSFSLLYDRLAAARQLQLKNEEAEQRVWALEAFVRFTTAVASSTDLEVLAHAAADVVDGTVDNGLSGFYLVRDEVAYPFFLSENIAPEVVGVLQTGIPLQSPLMHAALLHSGTFFADASVSQQLAMELGTLSVRVYRQNNRPYALLVTSTAEPVWKEQQKAIIESVGDGLGLALQRTEQTQKLHEERESLAAFAAFTEAIGAKSDVLTLARQAISALCATLPGISAAYYERVQERWVARVWSVDIVPDVVAQIQSGILATAPDFAQAVQSRQAVFQESWDALENDLSAATMYRAAGFLPLVVGGRTYGLLAVGTQADTHWPERERGIVQAVAQGLTLALERSQAAQQVVLQKREAERRTHALQAFAELSRTHPGETNRYVLIRRAQEIMLSLLTPGYALYWEAGEDRWQLKAQVGDIGDPTLQAFVDEYGLPLDAPALQSTWQTGVPNYQDNYAQGADTPAAMIRHVQAATAFRIQLYGQPLGMLAIGLFDQRQWTSIDKAALETAIYNLSLVLERAQGMEALANRTAQLAQVNTELTQANEELEAFTYSASHDMRAPVRHITGFATLALRALKSTPNPKVERQLEVITASALRINDMIDAMLALSRVGRTELRPRLTPLGALVEQARTDALLEFPEREVDWQIGPLPTVSVDRTLVQQVLTNLLSNAVKFAAPDRGVEVRVWAEEQSGAWTVYVRDNGVGFDPQYGDKLFGVFQRLHRQEEFAGTGIGLATVRRIITRHGGEVWAQSTVGQGATFAFTIPI